jgi:ribosomal protein S18 acetylase RimI-like enzyme
VPLVRPATDDDLEACVAIVRALPDFFTPDVPDHVRSDWERCRIWVATEQERVLGMVMAERRTPWAAEILWAAVHPDHRAGGIGTALVQEAVGDLHADGVRLVEVKTLDASADYEPYVATRAFWEARGFLKIDMIDPLPGWQPGNPAAIYVLAVSG